jgi:hypothetical protein
MSFEKNSPILLECARGQQVAGLWQQGGEGMYWRSTRLGTGRDEGSGVMNIRDYNNRVLGLVGPHDFSNRTETCQEQLPGQYR